MPEITLPEVKLPDIKLPDGFREMTKDDIVQAAKDVKLPKQVRMPDVDLSKVELPDAIADRMPGRRRPNPIVPLVALSVVGALIAAAWWLITSATTGPRIRRAVDDVKSRMNGDESDLIRYDDETHLDSLIGKDSTLSTPTTSDPWLTPDDGAVAVGPGMTAEEEMRARLG